MNIACPKCRDKGGDHSGTNLQVYPDGHKHCYVCDYHVNSWESEIEEIRVTSKLTIAQVLDYGLGTDPLRCLSDEIALEYQTRVAVSEETGKPATIYYPYYTDGTLTGYKVKNLPKEFRPSVGAPPTEMFGKELCEQKGHLLIVEGEEDCMAVRQMFTHATGYATANLDVVSLPNGASVCKAVRSDIAFFEQYKIIYIGLDNDEPGKKAQVELADWLSTFVQVKIIDYGLNKDASDYLIGGDIAHFRGLFKHAEIYEPEGVVNGIDIDLDDLLVPMPEGYIMPFEGLQDKLHGVRKGEILTVCAGSGIGKSTLVREITKSLIDQGLSVANVALEDQMNVAAQALIALDMDIPLSRFRFDPPTKEEAQPHHDKMIANGRTYFYKHFGGLTQDTLMNKMYYYARSKACDIIVLDHLSMVISASTSNNERKDIDTLMTNLAKMVVETGVGLIQIVHLKRKGEGTSYAHGGEVELSDLRGSASLEQLSWSVVGMERNQQGDDHDFSTIRILKNRTWGYTGKAGMVRYDPLTGRMKDVKESEVPDLDTEELTDED